MSDERISVMVMRIVDAVEKREQTRIADIIALLEEKGIVLAILLFSLPNSLPIPGIPGFSTITGIPIMFLGFQLMIGSHTLWLPKIILQHQLKAGKMMALLRKLIPYLERSEKFLRPRFSAFSHPPLSNALGLIIIVIAGILALPIVFMNFPCGIAITLITIGLISRDGVMCMVGVIFLPITLLTLFSVFGAATHGIEIFNNNF